MADVEEELWNIFTFYTLRGNPLDLTRLTVRSVAARQSNVSYTLHIVSDHDEYDVVIHNHLTCMCCLPYSSSTIVLLG